VQAVLPRPGRAIVLAGTATGLAALAAIAVVAALLGQAACSAAGTPSATAGRDIPPEFLALYRQIGARERIPWPILAGIGKEECDHGRNRDPSCTPRPGASGPGAANGAGAAGPMQIGVGGAAGCALCSAGIDAGGDGRVGAHDPADAVAMAARVLLAKGAPRGGALDAYRPAVAAYDGTGPAAAAYADRVLADARAYAADTSAASAPGGCAADALGAAGPAGPVLVAAGANRAGVALSPLILAYVRAMASLVGRPIVISTGTSHSQYTVDGNVSDHWDGHAADLGMAANHGTIDGPVGDALMSACLQLAGVPAARATRQARAGGLVTVLRAGLRIQCIWKTYDGGDHHDHVHVGVRAVQPGDH
jgi:hypothetical protein